MTNTYVTLLKPVDKKRTRTLATLAATAEARGLNILLLGAFARDLLFWHTHGIACHRETMDVDIVVQLADWTAYDRFRAALLDAGFVGDERDHPEKLRDSATKVEVDLLPFGEIAKDGESIVWPEDGSRWSVVGIQDAYDHALEFEVASDGARHVLRFVSIPALVLLKIVAVHDRPKRFKKDTSDVGFVIQEYLGIGNSARLQQAPHDDILKECDTDLDRATACLLGRDISVMISAKTKEYLVSILAKEVKSRSPCPFSQGLQRSLCKGDFHRARTIVGDILDGLKWSIPKVGPQNVQIPEQRRPGPEEVS